MTHRIQKVNGEHACEYRNVNGVKPIDFESADVMFNHARTLSEYLFKHLYGSKAYRYYAADNSMRIACVWKEPDVRPFVKGRAPEHKTSPKKNDQVIFIEEASVHYGKILWASTKEDEAGVLRFDTQEVETFPLDLFESTADHGLSIRWRIYL